MRPIQLNIVDIVLVAKLNTYLRTSDERSHKCSASIEWQGTRHTWQLPELVERITDMSCHC